LHGGAARHLYPCRRPIRLVQGAAGHPDADPADLHRHPRRPLAVRCAILRHLDDRLHRACRNYSAQLDPAGRFHPPCRSGWTDADGHPDRSRGDPLQADPAHRAGGDDRRCRHPRRPDLPGVGDLAAVRARLVDAAHRPGHPGDLPGATDVTVTPPGYSQDQAETSTSHPAARSTWRTTLPSNICESALPPWVPSAIKSVRPLRVRRTNALAASPWTIRNLVWM